MSLQDCSVAGLARPLFPLLAVVVLALAAGPVPAAGAEAPAGRRLESLDGGWRMLRADAPGAEQPAFDDRPWARVDLPHTFNARDAEHGGPVYRGPAWYRRTLDLDAAPAGRRAYLQFDGAYLVTQAWVNGQPAGRHAGGFAAFRFDVTDLLHAGRNVIAVRVDSAPRPTTSPLGGDFTPSGGLYRDVHLLWTDPVHVDALDWGGPGVYASAEDVTADAARIAVTVRARNDRPMAVLARVQLRIVDRSGHAVKDLSQSVDLASGEVRPVTLNATLDHPHLWDGRRSPYLYRVEAQVTDERGAADRVDAPLGVRSYRIDPDRGFLLNGRPYALHGVDYFHSGRPGRGLAVSASDVDQDMAILRSLGVTALRLVHFQHPQRTYDDADRDGVLLWTEIPVNSRVAPGAEFLADADAQLHELIVQNFNHPSVIVWGLGNEIFKADATASEVLDHLQQTAKALDPSRQTTYADCCHPEDGPEASATDVVGFNRYFGWYDGEVGELGPWADRTHKLIPTRAAAISEYGAGGSPLQQEDPAGRPKASSHWHPEQYQAAWHEAAWRQLRERSWLWGTFVWVGFDVVSSGRDEGAEKGLNDKGLVTLDRKTFKDAFFWYQANWTDRPMVHITSPRATPRTRAEVDVKVYTNAASVRLLLNGRDLGSIATTDHVAIRRGVELMPGVNHLEAVAGSARDSVDWSYAPGFR